MDQCKKDSEQVLLQRKPITSRSTPHAFTASKKDDDVLKKKGRTATKLSLKKCVSSFEMARFLALLTSIPPLEREGGKEGKDGRAAVVVSSFGGAVCRWSHLIYWNKREGMFKKIRRVLLVLSTHFYIYY
jgi:hypothetical protein